MDSFLMAAQGRISGQPSMALPTAPVRCGELLCQRDSYARSLQTVVVTCEPKVAAAPVAAKGGKKDKKGATPAPVQKLWDVVLGDTVLFPEGGGQPSDRGTVGGVECIRVENVDGTATHVCTEPLEPGAAVEVDLDWARREDNMCQHSTQVETTSWGLGEQTSFLELGTAEVSPAMLAELEAATNEAIKAGTPVTPSWHSVADVNDGNVPGLRKSSKALPPSVTGPVRVISFEGIDTNTCCGTHVQSTARLQAVKLLRVEKAKGCCKVHYVAGGRLVSYLGASFERASALASRMNVAQESMLERYDENQRKAVESERAAKALALEVVALLAEALRARAAAGERVLHVHRPAADADFIKALASSLDESLETAQGMLLVTVGEGSGEGTFTLAGPAALVDAASADVAKALEGRGGGKGGRYQGKCQKLGGIDVALAAAKATLVN